MREVELFATRYAAVAPRSNAYRIHAITGMDDGQTVIVRWELLPARLADGAKHAIAAGARSRANRSS